MREGTCRNKKVDMLRGIAIILVLIGHGLGLILNKGSAGGILLCGVCDMQIFG